MAAGLPDRAALFEPPLARCHDLNIGGTQMSTNAALKKMFSKIQIKHFLLILLCVLFLPFAFLTNEGIVYAGQTNLSWDTPSTNEDGTPLTDLAGFKIYYGTASGNYTQNIDVGNVTTYPVTNLTDGLTYYFVVTAYNALRNESRYSTEISKTLPGTPPQANTLTVNKGGTGTGTVISAPAGVSCGSDCTEGYSAGVAVTLTASPDTSSTFTGWSGACSGAGSCSVTMDAVKTVIATFTLKTYT